MRISQKHIDEMAEEVLKQCKEINTFSLDMEHTVIKKKTFVVEQLTKILSGSVKDVAEEE